MFVFLIFFSPLKLFYLAHACQAAATREALDVGATVAELGRLASAAFLSIGILALAVKVSPLKGYETTCAAALDAAALCASALWCFIVTPTFAIRMWRRI